MAVKNMSPTRKSLASQIAAAKKKYDKANRKVTDIQKAIKEQQKIIDKANDYLSKTNGYNTVKAAYNAAKADYKKIKAKYDKAKPKNKSKYKDKVKTAKGKMKSAWKDLKKIKYSTSAQIQFNNLASATKKIEAYKKSLGPAKEARKNAKKKWDALRNKKASKNKAAAKKKQKKNKAAISSKIKKQRKKKLAPQTALYRADLKTSSVCFLGEISPTESNDADGPTNAVDSGDPRTNYSVRTSKTLSGTYYLFATGGKTNNQRWANIDKHFESLQKWQREGLELCIRGFSKWAHVYMTNISKVSENKDQNALQLSITFSYKKGADVVYRKKKTVDNNHGTNTVTSGSDSKNNGNSKKKYHKIIWGDTYWGLARHYHTSVSKLQKLNHNMPLIASSKNDTNWVRIK